MTQPVSFESHLPESDLSAFAAVNHKLLIAHFDHLRRWKIVFGRQRRTRTDDVEQSALTSGKGGAQV